MERQILHPTSHIIRPTCEQVGPMRTPLHLAYGICMSNNAVLTLSAGRMRQSHILTGLSSPALASTSGRYLFQSSASSSLGAAGTVSTAAESGDVNVLDVRAKAGARRSKKRMVPSPEQVAIRSG